MVAGHVTDEQLPSHAPTVPGATLLGRRRGSPLWVTLRFVRRQPLGTIGGLLILGFFLVALLAPVVAPQGYNTTHLLAKLHRPSRAYPLGADQLGRDQLSRIIYGARTSMYVGLGTVAIATVLSVAIGMFSGFVGRWPDLVIQRVVDAWLAFPTLVILLSLMAVVGTGMAQVIAVLSVSIGIGGTRVVRSATLMFRKATFVEAARATGASTLRLLLQHVLPNLFGPIMVMATIGLSAAILAEAGLSFLGFGIPPPTPSWGQMLSGSAALYIYNAPWLAIFPGVAITLVVFGVNMFGDALRDELDPRLGGSRG